MSDAYRTLPLKHNLPIAQNCMGRVRIPYILKGILFKDQDIHLLVWLNRPQLAGNSQPLGRVYRRSFDNFRFRKTDLFQ